MAVFDRGVIQNQAQLCRGRHRYMAESSDPVDQAHAEAYRLAANTYSDISNAMIDPDQFPEDARVYPDRLREEWDRYCKTGIIADEIQELENAHVATLVGKDGKPATAAPTRRPRIATATREHINPRAIETVIGEMCSVLGIKYESPASEADLAMASGLVKASEPESAAEAASESETASGPEPGAGAMTSPEQVRPAHKQAAAAREADRRPANQRTS